MELKRKNRVNAEFSMASMTDIIFLLLIFFMITSSAISQSAIEVKLPTADSANPSVQDPSVVTIKEDGKYFVNDKEIAKDQLENYLVTTLKDVEKPSFTIRADENTKHKDVVFVMGIAENNQYNLSIATTQEE
ncbi:ExbD/TolR family protein [Kaistella antarctica]|uniref:Biopolymer transport protein ExbD n=1 Tax=Kaistella antarctica TaxID=266748 RepID=A0A448NSS2_9FLAO|nr:biopolymer transporter ExbD [Kaistella antarctica]KEY17947.1 biopolymer transporter ExbD [Kaistella antarctica]SEV81486.1 outer membrane transport energization protein ExbD [Kaistella antarctica]VEI00346.1 biopolymer transport protein ExbD [Kaistella antarctica]